MRRYLATFLLIVLGVVGLESLLWACLVAVGLVFQSNAVRQGPIVNTDFKIFGPSLLTFGRDGFVPITVTHLLERVAIFVACLSVCWFLGRYVRSWRSLP